VPHPGSVCYNDKERMQIPASLW